MDAKIKTLKTWYVYILSCSNNSYYTGYTNNLVKRFELHRQGKASKYTRSFAPISIAQSWCILGEKSIAMKLERFIKKLSRLEKEAIISNKKLLIEMDCLNISDYVDS